MARPAYGMMIAAEAMALALGACSPTVATHGNMLDAAEIAAIKPGTTTRDDLAATVGTPSASGTFDQKTWYYIGQKTEQSAFFKPEVIDRKVVIIHFDDNGVVTAINQLGPDDGQDVALVDRTTPTAGRELTLLEQLVGNLGKFNPTAKGHGPGSN